MIQLQVLPQCNAPKKYTEKKKWRRDKNIPLNPSQVQGYNKVTFFNTFPSVLKYKDNNSLDFLADAVKI